MPIPRPRTIRDPPEIRSTRCLDAAYSGTRHYGAERSLRGVAVGRRNWTFFGSDNGGKTAAVLTSIMATCQRVKVDPFAYLRDLLGRIAAHPVNKLDELLPANRKPAKA